MRTFPVGIFSFIFLFLVACSAETRFSEKSGGEKTVSSDNSQVENNASDEDQSAEKDASDADSAESQDERAAEPAKEKADKMASSETSSETAPSTQDPTPSASPAPTGNDVTVTVTTGDMTSVAPSSSEDKILCAQAMGVDISKIVDLGEKTIAGITGDSVLIATITGNAALDLDKVQTSSLSGICVRAQGTSNIQIETEVSFSALVYLGGGTSDGTFSFLGTATLGRVATADLGGSSSLHLKGPLLECDKLSQSVGSNTHFSCAN